MIEIKTKQPQITMNLDGSVNLSFVCEKSAIEPILALKSEFIVLQAKEYHEKRTLTQNNYLWKLLDLLSQKMTISRVDLYKKYIREYGKIEFLVMSDNAVDYFIKQWEKNGLGCYAEISRKANTDGYSVVAVYFGSSTYNTQEMTNLIKPIVADCEEIGIPTLSLDEFQKLKN